MFTRRMCVYCTAILNAFRQILISGETGKTDYDDFGFTEFFELKILDSLDNFHVHKATLL